MRVFDGFGLDRNDAAASFAREERNGTNWSISSSANTSTSALNILYAVSCSGPLACTAVGTTIEAGYETLVEAWNGTSWSIVLSPNTPSSANNILNGVSCAGLSACTAVGYSNSGTTSTDQTLTETWNGGAWSIVSSPDTSSTESNYLEGVSCTEASACVAVGEYFNGTVDQTLVEVWNGTSWAIASSPDTSTSQDNVLFAVACTGTSTCRAVGYSSDGANPQTLTMAENGATVPVAPTVTSVSPNTGPTTGGTAITITGTGFVAGATVTIGQGSGAVTGAIHATNVKVVSSTEITATTGGGAKTGTWSLFVTTSGGTSAGNTGDNFTYWQIVHHRRGRECFSRLGQIAQPRRDVDTMADVVVPFHQDHITRGDAGPDGDRLGRARDGAHNMVQLQNGGEQR
jgi:hypothetical protein